MMSAEIYELEIKRIRPNYRLVYDENVIRDLYEDIRARGLREPLVVELVEYWFQIVDGEKRWRACKIIGLERVRAVILETSLP
jgi:ParB family chromosome partitioning protein